MPKTSHSTKTYLRYFQHDHGFRNIFKEYIKDSTPFRARHVTEDQPCPGVHAATPMNEETASTEDEYGYKVLNQIAKGATKLLNLNGEELKEDEVMRNPLQDDDDISHTQSACIGLCRRSPKAGQWSSSSNSERAFSCTSISGIGAEVNGVESVTDISTSAG
jgi:hypothetical protein